MGFTEGKAQAALKACEGSVERAMDWLFSHAEDMEEQPAASASSSSSSSAGAGAPGAGGVLALPALPANARYILVGIVSHMGSSLASGHYVAHIRKDEAGRPAGAEGCADPKWVLFNDEKVALSQDPPLEAGFMYMYKRV
jgi:ubiquitin carboxyl-terminal hydrolase 5/13